MRDTPVLRHMFAAHIFFFLIRTIKEFLDEAANSKKGTLTK